jgi:outer membrane protein TolC
MRCRFTFFSPVSTGGQQVYWGEYPRDQFRSQGILGLVESFHDPLLDELVLIAYNQNLILLSAGTKVLQARAVLGIAIGEFYPQVQQATGSLAL